MKKNLFLVALATMSLASCSNDDVLEIKQDVISFDIIANNGSRASVIYSNSEKPTSFQVTAIHTDAEGAESIYIDDETVTLKNGSYVFADNQDRYWPATGSLTFYAVVEPKDYIEWTALGHFYDASYKKTVATDATTGLYEYNITIGQPGNSTADVVARGTAKDHHDLLYAVAAGKTKTADGDAPVMLNFRHAFSQIVFNATHSSKTISVKVNKITLRNINSGMGITLPTTSTDLSTLSNASVTGLWPAGVGVSVFPDKYTLSVEPKDTDKEVILTAEKTEHNLTYGETALLLPAQNIEKGDVLAPSGGFVLMVDCEIYNVAAGDKVAIFDGVKNIPMDIDWVAGMKYIYTLKFEGDKPISFDLKVEPFVDVENDVTILYE